MIQLPSNAVPAILGLLLGLLVGAGVSYFLLSEPEARPLYDGPGLQAVELSRWLAPEDTSGQETPRTEIRYRTVRDTVRDTLFVPTSLSDGVVSDRTPLDITEDRATWTYYDPQESRFEQRVFAVPQDALELYTHGLVRAWAPLDSVSPRLDRVYLGAGLGLRYKRLRVHISALTTPTLSEQRVSLGVVYRF